jgi:hypothetical protein
MEVRHDPVMWMQVWKFLPGTVLLGVPTHILTSPLSTHIYTRSHIFEPYAPIMQEGDRRREVVVSLVSELVLCVKEANTKTRGTAYALLVQVGGTGREGGRKGEALPVNNSDSQ